MSARFVTDSELNASLERIFREAKEQLILISPYILLHDRLQAILKTRLEDDMLDIVVVFGKNEEDPSRSMKRSELEFFMQFPAIEIRHERRLHAKYYTNDKEALITSMNLYRYSQDNNIESGILTSVPKLKGLANQITGTASIDMDAFCYFDQVIEQAELIYKKEPEYEKVMFGLNKKYLRSNVVTDQVDSFFAGKSAPKRTTNSTRVSKPASAPSPSTDASKGSGYCIRTGKAIPFNVEKPLSYDAYKSWSKYSDKNYAEKYCHFSGEASNGETSVAKPILKKNWSKAKAAH